MARLSKKTLPFAAVALTMALTLLLTPAPLIDAADHGDAPVPAQDRGADLADCYLFLDPNDNTRVIVALTVSGFISPGENGNFGIFDPALRYRFEIEQTGDARPDRFIDVRFTRRVANAAGVPQPQMATITLPDGSTFMASATNSSPTADTSPAPVITTGPNGVLFFAGLVDDPFNFDIPGFGRFVASVRAGSPNPAVFNRGRDSFAGYNNLAIAFSFPVAQLVGANNMIGLAVSTQRRAVQVFNSRIGQLSGSGRFVNIDRTGVPAVNVALVPFNQKDEFNAATTLDDANGRFAPGIIATLQFFGTNQTNINILASVAVLNGDILRLNTTVANTGNQGGGFRSDTPGDRIPNDTAGFPNGRRVGDDVIDTLLFFIANQNPLSDNANQNDVPYRNTFPFFGASHQPFPPGTLDDRTRN